jgi:hypothetical protein
VLKGPPLTPKLKPQEGEKGQEGKLKGKKNHQKKELEKLDNAADDETYHASKKERHIRYTGHHIGPCSCRQGKKWA